MPESLNWARKALAANPESANAYYALASVYMATGEFSKSRAAFRRCLELDENNTSALNNLSLVETSLANYDEALRLGRHAMVLNPYEPGNYYHLGSSVRIIGSREQQAKWLEVWRARFPRYVRTLTAQVSAEFTYGSRELAMAEMRKILQVHKGNREVDWTAADIAMACSAPDAEELVRRASGGVLDANYGQYSIFPESPRARLAWFLLKRGDRAGAEKMLADAERQATEHWRAGIESGALAVELAAIMSMRDDADQAATWMQRAFELGWREWIDNADPMLAPAASNPRFQAVVKQIQDDIRRQAAESLLLKALFEETVPSLPPPPHPAGNQPAPN